jgi:hypothetical protein
MTSCIVFKVAEPLLASEEGRTALSAHSWTGDAYHCPPRGAVIPLRSTPRYNGVSRTIFSTLASSTVSLDKYSSAATWAAVI